MPAIHKPITTHNNVNPSKKGVVTKAAPLANPAIDNLVLVHFEPGANSVLAEGVTRTNDYYLRVTLVTVDASHLKLTLRSNYTDLRITAGWTVTYNNQKYTITSISNKIVLCTLNS